MWSMWNAPSDLDYYDQFNEPEPEEEYDTHDPDWDSLMEMGDDGSEVRREPALGCPTHTEEDRDAGRVIGCEICYRDFLEDDIREIDDPNGETFLGVTQPLVQYACEPCARKQFPRERDDT